MYVLTFIEFHAQLLWNKLKKLTLQLGNVK